MVVLVAVVVILGAGLLGRRIMEPLAGGGASGNASKAAGLRGQAAAATEPLVVPTPPAPAATASAPDAAAATRTGMLADGGRAVAMATALTTPVDPAAQPADG